MNISMYERTYIANQILQTTRNTIGISNIQNAVKSAIIGFGDVDVKINGVMTLYNLTSDASPDFVQQLTCCIANVCISLIKNNLEAILNSKYMNAIPSTITTDMLKDIVLSNDIVSRLFIIVPSACSIEIIC